jgi:uncharacterized protein YbbC (DUF1343 family)
MEPIVQTGLERLCAAPPGWLNHRRLGLLCNAASVDRRFRHARDLLNTAWPGGLRALYSPQHGFFTEKQDNMVESDHTVDPALGIPVFSLYGQTRQPTAEMFAPIDVLVVDLQDVGTRVYTFIYTLSYCMEAARRWGKTVLVLDRPNPVGGTLVEGNCLADDCTSFVGRYPIPMRHGLTIAELALMFDRRFGIDCDLQVLPMSGWTRDMVFEDTGLPWLAPSPNLPTPAAAAVYPGQVIWEGTNVSEGRGTTQPFEQFGAPYIDPAAVLSALGGGDRSGAVLRPVTFEPVANKWSGQPCRGFQIHVTDRGRYRPYATSLKLLQAVMQMHPRDFRWKPPPYEYEFDRRPIDLIIGDVTVRRRLAAFEPVETIAASWQADLDAFSVASRECYLYQ